MSERGAGPLPNRWLYCPNKSDNFIADKFLAFKTPLNQKFDVQMPIECQFHPESLFKLMKNHKIKIGLWIDLTNTSRFYDKRTVEANDCRYVKLQCRGHGETPSNEQTQSFIEIVDNFINENPLEMVGVHCTHGFNRTGFLIIAYMVEKMDCSVEAALMAFSQARPPGIYKGDYIRELFRRYEDEEDAIAPPELPDWCQEFDDNDYQSTTNSYNNQNEATSRKRKIESTNSTSYNDNDDQANENDDSNEGESSKNITEPTAKRKKRREFLNLNATFMAGISGVTLVTKQPKLGVLQAKVQEMCDWKGNGFPGCQPVSMDLNNLQFLHTKPYRVSWKADGTRYMMLILKEGEIYFFDRDHACFQVSDMKFPHRKDLRRHIKDTLVDGEMVIDKVNGLSIPRYLVYDIIKFENEDLGKQAFFPTRLKCIEVEIIAPRHEAMKRGLIHKTKEPFSVRHKMFWDLTQAKALLGSKFAETLSHEPDGLIFQPSVEPYFPGRCDEVLKWKPSNKNSVDFKLRITEESGKGILCKKIGCLYVGQLDAVFAQIKYTKQLKELDNKIIECKFENNSWVYMKERTDKSFPNSFTTAKAVCESIKHPVTTAILLDFIDKRRFMDDSDAMPPPPRRNNVR